MIKVLIVDDERNIHKAYALDLQKRKEKYQLIDSLTSGEDALMLCQIKDIDLILMDIVTTSGENGLLTSKKIKEKYPNIKIIITTSYIDQRIIQKCQDIPVDGLWFKDYSPIDLISVIDQVCQGQKYFSSESPDIAIGNINLSQLTSAEKEVLYCLCECISIKGISEKLCIEESTVKTHLKNIYNKTGYASKTELLIQLLQNKAILPD